MLTTAQTQRTPLRWQLALWCARHMGMFRHEGMHCMAPSWLPLGRVKYPPDEIKPEGCMSVTMPLGNAVDMAACFTGAEVIPAEQAPKNAQSLI